MSYGSSVPKETPQTQSFEETPGSPVESECPVPKSTGSIYKQQFL